MPVRQRDQADVGGPSGSSSSSHRGWDQDIKPRSKAKAFNDDVIDLCDSDDDDTPKKSAPSGSASKPKRSAGRNGKLKYEDDGSRSPSRSPNSSDDDDEDDFIGSNTKRRTKKPALSSKAESTTPKLYAIARIATLATDGVASLSESEAKLAGINPGILSRIQKSLALAKHPGTGEAEAQQALRLATRLMSSQNLTQADLLASSDAETNASRAGMSIVEIVSQTHASPRNESWVNQIAIAVNMFFDVKAYSTSYENRTRLSWTFYGVAVNTVAAAHAFEMVHNQVLTWANEKVREKRVKGKTGKNSYCQGVAAGLIALAKREKKEEMRLAIESEKRRLKDAEDKEQEQIKKERQRLDNPLMKEEASSLRVKAEPGQDSLPSSSRNVKLEDVIDEEDVKPFRNGIKRSASEDQDQGYGRWTDDRPPLHPKLEPDLDYDSDNDDFHDPYDPHRHEFTPGLGDDLDEDLKPNFDEALERDIIDLTDDLDDSVDIKPKLEPEDVKPKLEEGAGWMSGGQLIRFRQDAERTADDFLASQHSGLKLKKRAKSTYKKDARAFEQGREDAKKIDVKRKRIQG